MMYETLCGKYGQKKNITYQYVWLKLYVSVSKNHIITIQLNMNVYQIIISSIGLLLFTVIYLLSVNIGTTNLQSMQSIPSPSN